MDRLAGTVSMVVLGGSLITWNREWLATAPVAAGVMRGIALYLAVLALLVAASVALCAGPVVSRLPARLPGRARLVELTGVYFRCAVLWPRTLAALGVSMLMLAVFFLSYYFSARAYGVDIGAGKFLAMMPAVDIIAGLPLSLGGLGVREGTFALLLGALASVSAPTAMAVSLAGYMMSAVWGIPGAFFWLLHRREIR
jgi:uncharacterized membrane protein YbhN (UPF0104 family)